MSSRKNLKVVIAAGGDGTRLGDLNPESKPKSLLFFNDKPLISYQLEVLIDRRINEICLSFNNQEQINEFKNYLTKGLIPQANYIYNTHSPIAHQSDLFKTEVVKDYIRNYDFLFTHGDIVADTDIFERLIDIYEKTGCSVIIKEYAKKLDRHQFLLTDGYISGIKNTDKVAWRYGGIFIIQKDDQEDWLSMCHAEHFRSWDFFERCLARNAKVYVADIMQGDHVINVNTPSEYKKAEEHFRKLKEGVLK